MEFDNNVPIYLQVIREIKQSIVNGTLALGEKLPSARELAIQYQINPNTANRIYRDMEADGLCFTRRGLGTFVTEAEETRVRIREEMAEQLLFSFVKGMRTLGYEKEALLRLLEQTYDAVKETKTETEDLMV